MRKLLRCLFLILLLVAGIAFSGGPAVAPLEASGVILPCDETVQVKGRSLDVATLMCSGMGSDCAGAMPN